MDNQYWLSGWCEGWENANAVGRPIVSYSLKKYFYTLPLAKNATVLVPLCGKSFDMIWLAQQGMHVVGIELSDIACKGFFEKYDLPYKSEKHGCFTLYKSELIELWCGDIFNFRKYYTRTIDAIYDCAALIAIAPDKQAHYIKCLKSLIKPGTPLLLNSIEANLNANAIPPYPVSQERIYNLCSNLSEVTTLMRKPAKSVPQHLSNRGTQSITCSVYLLKSLI